MTHYQKLAKKVKKRDIETLNGEFINLRERYLMYILDGVQHTNAVENALFDIFEGNDDFHINFQDAHIINLLSLIIVFDNAETFNLLSEDYVRMRS